MKILVTGATSGLGRNAVEWLLAAGHQVHATGRDRAVGALLQQTGAAFTALDLASATVADCAALVEGADAVWHCAAKSSPWGRREDFWQANVVATERLTAAAGQQGVARFIHISTPAIYFDYSPHYDIAETFRARRFASHYAASKFAAEQVVVQRVAQYAATTFVMLRPRALFGAHDRVIVPRLLAQLRRDNGVLRLPNGGTALLDLTFVLNVVQAMWLATELPALNSGAVYNITNQQPVTLAQVLHQLLNQQLGLACEIRSLPASLLYGVAALMEGVALLTRREPLLTRYSVGAVSTDMTLSQRRTIDELGYRPHYSMEEAIALTGAWWRQQGVGKLG
ncbi:NAD-dependent epimerase/dehydratase family protein [Erwinia sorbitola]|uniref:NAD-dependent epimerase/dehydratase family protein n=1 Tax=Erwinia sorbitola TaxID=2681984 RepID=A0ABW9REE0_9GAMM|nr:NAD-dependent epimerase/dehydratase family protein [Erwinia sorbitola]MTD28377.1 NAD-dependent epimerase/dehydratase family protein [Erwinia sorbitola]